MSSFDKDPNKVVLYEEGFENEEECFYKFIIFSNIFRR